MKSNKKLYGLKKMKDLPIGFNAFAYLQIMASMIHHYIRGNTEIFLSQQSHMLLLQFFIL